MIGPHRVYAYPDPTGGVSSSVALVPAPGGGLRAFFAGLSPASELRERMATATSVDGVTWIVQPTPASDDRPGMGSPVYAAAGIGGTICEQRRADLDLGRLRARRSGLPRRHRAAPTPDVHFGGSSAHGRRTERGDRQRHRGSRDRVERPRRGPHARPVDRPGRPARVNTPGGQAPDALERVGMTGRADGGRHLRCVPPRHERLHQQAGRLALRGRHPMVLSPKRRALPGRRRAADGRLWAFWALQRDNYRIFAARSNQAATQFGARRQAQAAGGTRPCSASRAREPRRAATLDLVALVSAAATTSRTTTSASGPGSRCWRSVLGNGEVRFTTLDAGDPLATTIKFAGKTKQTGPDGKVVTSAGEPGKKSTARATNAGLPPGVAPREGQVALVTSFYRRLTLFADCDADSRSCRRRPIACEQLFDRPSRAARPQGTRGRGNQSRHRHGANGLVIRP